MQRDFLLTGLLTVVIVTLLASCATQPDVIGRWQRVDGVDTLEFRADGTFTTVDNMGTTAEGQYTLHADGTLYYAVTHTDIMQATLNPVPDFEVRIAGVRFYRYKYELAVETVDSAEAEVYRRVGRF